MGKAGATAQPGATLTRSSGSRQTEDVQLDEEDQTDILSIINAPSSAQLAPPKAKRSSWFYNPFCKNKAQNEEKDEKAKKDKVQFLSRRSALGTVTTMQNILQRKIFVSESRAEYLTQLQGSVNADPAAKAGQQPNLPVDSDRPSAASIASAGSQRASGVVDDDALEGEPAVPADGKHALLLLNVPAADEAYLRAQLEETYHIRSVTIVNRDFVSLMKTANKKFDVLSGSNFSSSREPSQILNDSVQRSLSVEDPVEPEVTTTKGIFGRTKKKSTNVDKEEKKKEKKRPPLAPQVVVVGVTAERTDFERACVAVHFMSSRIVIPFVQTPADSLAAAHQYWGDFMKNTWPVMNNSEAVAAYAADKVLPILRLRRCIYDDVFGRISHYGKVNYVWHGMKRVPVAFVPFGVAAVNLLGLTKLVGSVLGKTGMTRDSEAKKAGVLSAAQSYAQIWLLDSVGDVYQLAAASSVTASIAASIAETGSVVAAAEALSGVDFFLLGSSSIVTGAIAAIGAALTRPQMVRGLASLIATLQTLWLLFPQARRDDEAVAQEHEGQVAQVTDVQIQRAKAVSQLCQEGHDCNELDDDEMTVALEVVFEVAKSIESGELASEDERAAFPEEDKLPAKPEEAERFFKASLSGHHRCDSC